MEIQNNTPQVSVVLPCLNEAAGIGTCIEKIQHVFKTSGIHGEIVVCDNGSTDNSAGIARSLGARVVSEERRGYGYAYLTGLDAACGDYLVMGDADDTYDFGLIPRFLEKMKKENYAYVTGSRYAKESDTSQIPFLHRVIGNPLLTLMLNILFGTRYSDVNCGLRAFTKTAYQKIKPVSKGMEFAMELAINAHLAGLAIAEIPIHLMPRKGESKLRTFTDGWRSLRLLLLYCPNKVFFIPGSILFAGGMIIHAVVLLGLIQYAEKPLGVVTSIMATIFSVTGFQILTLGLQAKTYSWANRFIKDNSMLHWFYRYFTLEKGLLLGGILFFVGSTILIYFIFEWAHIHFGELAHPAWIAFAATLFIIGLGTIFSSLFISAMDIKGRDA